MERKNKEKVLSFLTTCLRLQTFKEGVLLDPSSSHSIGDEKRRSKGGKLATGKKKRGENKGDQTSDRDLSQITKQNRATVNDQLFAGKCTGSLLEKRKKKGGLRGHPEIWPWDASCKKSLRVGECHG